MKNDIKAQATYLQLGFGGKSRSRLRQAQKVQEARGQLQGAVDRDEAANSLGSIAI